MGFDRCLAYRPGVVFGDQRLFPGAKYVTAPFQLLTYVTSSLGIHVTTIPKVLIKKTATGKVF